MGKLIIFSAPSGSGKSTIINYLLTQNLNLAFSISATSRPPRGTEQNGVEYFFLTPDEFRSRIANDEFLEYEEVYQDRFYGTLKAQVEKQLAAGQNVVFDVDVVGGCNIKKFYGERALSVFIQHDELDRGGAYVDACLIRFHGEPLFSCRCDLAVKESRRIFRLLL
jgi:guanylate kinase